MLAISFERTNIPLTQIEVIIIMKIVQLAIDIDSDLLERIEKAANSQGKHLNDFILDCLEEHVDRQERIE